MPNLDGRMYLQVSCPRCHRQYQVDPDLRGQHMRCPNMACRTIFEVREGEGVIPAPMEDAFPEPLGGRPMTGSVGELVPILPAEEAEPERAVSPSPQLQEIIPPASAQTVEEAQTPIGRAPAAWQQGPPPVRLPPTALKEPGPTPVTPFPGEEELLGPAIATDLSAPAADRPVELGPEAWQAPPVRSDADGFVSELFPEATSPRAPSAVTAPLAVPGRRRSRWLIAGLLLILAAGLAGGFVLIQGTRPDEEAVQLKRAEELYQDKNFADAAIQFRQLLNDFPESKNSARYRFLAELSDIRETVYNARDADESGKAFARLYEFLQLYRDDSLLKPEQGEVWRTLYRAAKGLTSGDQEENQRELLALARQALKEAKHFEPPSGADPLRAKRDLEETLAVMEKRIKVRERRQDVLAQVEALAAKPSADAVRKSRQLVVEAGFEEDGEFKKMLRKLVEGHRAAITYTEVSNAEERPSLPADHDPSLLVVPPVGTAQAAEAKGLKVVFALARGVLHALEPKTGEVRWARRVGVDTTQLPVRLPATPISSAAALVLSSDRQTISAVVLESGVTIWEHPLHGPCLGQPVLVKDRILLPTEKGRVEEIEATGGRLLGYYDFGQPLTVGGVRQEGTFLVYFPADNYSVYVLDVAKRTCAAILYSGHASGSLRGRPIILADPDYQPPAEGQEVPQGIQAYLVLSQADGLDAVRLRVFGLPLSDPDQAPLPLDLRTRGWSWFPPFHDGARLAQVTDAGSFSLYGRRQKGNRDPVLFPMLKDDVLLGRAASESTSRAQIVHGDNDGFWAVAHGRLHHLHAGFSRATGPVLTPSGSALVVGSPLHEAQVHVDDSGRATFFLVTRAADDSACLVSAVDPKQGKIIWQRQLGVVAQAQPFVAGGKVYLRDRKGILVHDPAKVKPLAVGSWLLGTVFHPLPGDEGTHFLSSDGGATVYAVRMSMEETGPALRLDLFQEAKRTERLHPLPAKLGGTPAIGRTCMVLPLANGILARVPLGDGPPVFGPNWRAAGADEDAPGHAVHLSADDFLVTDGSRGLKIFSWPDPKGWEMGAEAQLSSRIVTVPAVSPRKEGEELRIWVADATQGVSLLQGQRVLRVVRRWSVQGSVTSGPFVGNQGAGCVVGRNRLVWLDPGNDLPLWEYTFHGAIVGRPELVDGQVFVADLSGQFTALDLATGDPSGPGYKLRADVAPAAAAVSSGNGQLFAPLTDGTVLLLSRKHFQHPLLSFPIFR
jgi:outer membrane protein assembly factor BamB